MTIMKWPERVKCEKATTILLMGFFPLNLGPREFCFIKKEGKEYLETFWMEAFC